MSGGGTQRLRVTLKRSLIRSPVRRRACVAGLGLRRVGQTVELEDTPAVRGMIAHARHLLAVVAAEPMSAASAAEQN